MASMFDNFNSTLNSDNRFKFIAIERPEKLVIGGSTRLVFKLPFKWSTYVLSAIVIFKQGLDVLLTKSISASTVIEADTYSVIQLDLTAEDTRKFSYNALDTSCQIRLELKSGKTFYGDIYQLKVLNPLDGGKELIGGESI